MAMSRKHYREFAEMIKSEVEDLDKLTPAKRNLAGAHVVSLANKMARVFKSDNNAFRYDTFFEAAGLDAYGNLLRK